MAHLSVSFELGTLDPEQAEAACFAAGAVAVTLSDAEDQPVYEPRPGEVRLWRRTRLEALFTAAHSDPLALVGLAGQLGIGPERLAVRSLADRVWEREWLRDFHAMRFGNRLWVCPTHEPVTDPGAVVVRLDPGLAFGTGTHATTALCLRWLDGASLQGRTVLDYGCGSGILAIAALQLGAAHAWAFDIDPQALIATRENGRANGVETRLTCCEQLTQLPSQHEVLLANILADVLISHADDLAARAMSGARLLLAGILSGQENDVAEAFAPWFDINVFAHLDGWVALSGRRRASHTHGHD